MNEQRAFTVVVTGCKNCPRKVYFTEGNCFFCAALIGSREEFNAVIENKHAITPSCPMYDKSKPIGELK